MVWLGVIINDHSLHYNIITYLNYYLTRNKLITAAKIAVQPVYILFSNSMYQGEIRIKGINIGNIIAVLNSFKY